MKKEIIEMSETVKYKNLLKSLIDETDDPNFLEYIYRLMARLKRNQGC